MSIMIVEDNPVSAKFLERALTKYKYSTTLVQNGKQGLDHLNSTPGIELVITDLMMRDMDGLELLEHIRTQSVWNDIPVILITGVAEPDKIKKAASLGCHHYMLKPVNPAKLVQRVQEILEHEPVLLRTKAQICAGLDIDEQSYEEIAHAFANQLRTRLTPLEEQLREKITQELLKDLLDLEESATTLGAERLEKLLNKVKEPEKEKNVAFYPVLAGEMKLLLATLALQYKGSENTAKGPITEETPVPQVSSPIEEPVSG